MDSEYHTVTDKISTGEPSVKSILKQMLVCSSVIIQFFISGLCAGTPTILIPQLQKEANSTQIIDDELISWLYATSGFSVIPWVIVLPLLTQRVGRKPLQTISAINSMMIFIILYYSQTPQHILISEVFQGYMHAGCFTVSHMMVTEFSSPKLRGLFLSLQSAAFFWGVWVANAIGTFYQWKNIALLGLLCAIFMFSIVFCPESPYWLASRGRFEECKVAFRWIHGFKAENDLRALISQQQDNVELKNKVNVGFKNVMKSPEFYNPLILSIIGVVQYLSSGKIFCSLFILDIVKKITSSEGAAYTTMLVLDGATVFSMYIGTYLSKVLRRRLLLLSSSFAGVFFLLLISLYLFLVRVELLEVNHYCTLALLTVYSVSISVGPMILSMSIYGELISRRFQSISYIIVALTIAIPYAILVKTTPDIFAALGLDGSFLLYGVVCGLCTVYLYVYLPETKDKTPLEIEEHFGGKQLVSEVLLR